MRKTYLLFASASVAILSACGSQSKGAIDADLKKDLELASSDDAFSLGNGAVTSGQQFVSSIERTSPPARKAAASARVKRHKVAPKAPPQVVKTEAPADVTESEIQSVETAPTEVALDAPVSPRPQPIAVSYPSGESSVGSSGGAVIGTIIGAVVRGGIVGGIDHCDERTGRGRGTIAVHQRFPGRSGLGRVAVVRGRPRGDIMSRFPH